MSKITVIGCGAWGATVAKIVAENNHDVKIWCHDIIIAEEINKKHTLNLLPEIILPENITATTSLDSALNDSEGIILAVASNYLTIIEKIKNKLNTYPPILSLTKGLLDNDKHLFVSQYLTEKLGKVYPLGFLSGPNLAIEIAKKKPAATVIASHDTEVTLQFQKWLSTEYFRVYTQNDIIGVELGGVLKNAYAIAAGIMDGYNLGENAKAAMISRALQEMIRFGKTFNAKEETFMGLSGLGDLMATCSSPTSRNWKIGAALADHGNLQQAINSLGSISEGVKTTKIMVEIAQKNALELPIAEEIHAILYENKAVNEALICLMERPLKSE